LRGRMARIDWCIVPSLWWEAFALVISEAWMFGKPVICSNVGAMADRVTDEADGAFRDGRRGGVGARDEAGRDRAGAVATPRRRPANAALAQRDGRRLPRDLPSGPT